MANVRSGNSYYVDSTGTLEVPSLSVFCVLLTSTSAAGSITLQDDTTPAITKMTLKVPNGESVLIDFNNMPVTFSQGIVVSAISNAVATIVFKENNR